MLVRALRPRGTRRRRRRRGRRLAVPRSRPGRHFRCGVRSSGTRHPPFGSARFLAGFSWGFSGWVTRGGGFRVASAFLLPSEAMRAGGRGWVAAAAGCCGRKESRHPSFRSATGTAQGTGGSGTAGGGSKRGGGAGLWARTLTGHHAGEWVLTRRCEFCDWLRG
jgi:hypothetical protein